MTGFYRDQLQLQMELNYLTGWSVISSPELPVVLCPGFVTVSCIYIFIFPATFNKAEAITDLATSLNWEVFLFVVTQSAIQQTDCSFCLCCPKVRRGKVFLRLK
jgi:hypothetical protein